MEVGVETLINLAICNSVVNTDVASATVGYVVPQSDCSAFHIALNSEGQICSANILLWQDLELFICLVPAADIEVRFSGCWHFKFPR